MVARTARIDLPQPLVTGAWLKKHADLVRIVDCRWYLDGRSGLDAYKLGHIPGALWVDVEKELSDLPSKTAGRHPLPSPNQFARAMQRLGIDNHTAVVAYDDAGGSVAARLWFMLHVHSHPVAVLEGGIDAWPGKLAQWIEPRRKPRPGTFTSRPWPRERFVEPDDFGPTDLIVDARSPSRYAKGDAMLDPRPGHIPGARNLYWKDNLNDEGLFKSKGELAERYRTQGAARASRVVAYCGSGITACHDLLALELADLGGETALYAGSWSQWAADRSRPVKEGKHP